MFHLCTTGDFPNCNKFFTCITWFNTMWARKGRSLSTWIIKVRNTTLLRTTTVQVIIAIHEVQTVCLFDSRCSERLHNVFCFKFTFQRLLNVLFSVLGSYVPYSTKRQHITYMENFWKFWIFWNSFLHQHILTWVFDGFFMYFTSFVITVTPPSLPVFNSLRQSFYSTHLNFFPFPNQSLTSIRFPPATLQVWTESYLPDISTAWWCMHFSSKLPHIHSRTSLVWIGSITGSYLTGSRTIPTSMIRKWSQLYTRRQRCFWTKINRLVYLTILIRLIPFHWKRMTSTYASSSLGSSSEGPLQCPGTLRSMRASSKPLTTCSSHSNWFPSASLPVGSTFKSAPLATPGRKHLEDFCNPS